MNSLQKGRQIQVMLIDLNQAKMTESKSIQTIVNQVTMQAVAIVTMALRDADVQPKVATTASLRKPKRESYNRPPLE